ncbi:MAG TPA: glycine--tRNA ligase subunit beta [Croceibacterium sp.]|nr:glycine--tRNA ligase subunit beta [Croceibacterium sp.]
MADFLLELRSEEIPARMQAGARADLEKLFRAEMQAAGVASGEVNVWSTPRRLALIAHDLPATTEAVSEETKGPRVGAPPQALEGFLRKTGLAQDQLQDRDGTYFAVVEKPGRAVKVVLAEAIPAIVARFPWPKSMRWGAASLSTESLRWVRPLSGIVAIFGEELVECQVGDIASGYMTLGHRFHCAGPIIIGSASDYQEKLRACHVIVDHAERQDLIRAGAAKTAADAGLKLVEDEGLVIENAGLTEWPVPLLGRFDEAFLDVPPEVIQLTARVNQKYFVCESGGKLANAFVCTANIEAGVGGAAIVDGNRKVLAARLSDARFFWEQDRKVPLAEQAKKLDRITFHEKLGTVADKVERVAKLARWLVEEGIVKGADPDLAEKAARLAKADLVTEMVGEFPELQGVMGGYYAGAEGLPAEVADAIRDHYKPVGQGDEVPTAPVTVAVSLADKLDTLVGFFETDLRPSGSKDPFALRRAGLSITNLAFRNKLRMSLRDVVLAALTDKRQIHDQMNPNYFGVANFLTDRLKVQQREAGVRHDLIDAVFALGNEDDLVRLLARVNALQNFIATEDGANLLFGYKRAANILKKEDWKGGTDDLGGEIARTGEEDPLALVDDPDLRPVIDAKLAEKKNHLSYTPEPAEKDLIEALDSAEPKAAAAVQAEDFEAAMAALASLRGPIDRFFDSVTVNDGDRAKREARLSLLARFRAAVHKVADFSKIEG